VDEAWVAHNKVRAREVGAGLDIEVEGVSTQARYYKPLIYEFFRKVWRGARPAWGEFSVEIAMDYVGDPPWLDLDNLAKAVLDAIKGYAFHDDAQVCRLVVARYPSDTERIRISVRKVADLASWPKG
jgi:crossover junction endodeoxyribonuclease RusA